MTKFGTKIAVLLMFIILSLSLVGTASWMIILSSSQDVDSADEYSNPCFTSEGVYNGDEQLPTLNEIGIEVYGEEFISGADCSITYVRGVDAIGNSFADFSGNESVAVGTHYYKITDNVTGQVICEEHAYRITPSPLIIKDIAITEGTKSVLFVGDTLSLDITVNVPKGATNFDKVITVTYPITTSDYAPSSTMAYAPTVLLDVEEAAMEAGFSSTYNVDVSLPIRCDLDGIAVILPTTYITTTASATPLYYGTLNDALDFASTQNAAGTKVVAMQSFNYGEDGYSSATLTAANDYTHQITRNTTIATNVTLVLPIDIDGETTNYRADPTDPYYKPAKKPSCVNLATLNSGVKLTVQGTIIVGGIVGTQNSAHPQGVTSNSFAAINAKSGSLIELADGALLDCFGYIFDPDYDSGLLGAKIKAASGSTIKMPFVVHDYHGGTHTVGCYHRADGTTDDAICPFNVFDFPNIHATLVCSSGSGIKGYADLWAGDEHNYAETDVFGDASTNSFLTLTSGSATFKYTPVKDTVDNDTGVRYVNYQSFEPTYDAKTHISLNGNAKTGSLSLTVQVNKTISGINVNVTKTVQLADVRIPISHKFQIELNGKHTYQIMTDYKFLPGSILTVREKAKLKIASSASAIFYSDGIYKTKYTVPATDSTPAKEVWAAQGANIWAKDKTALTSDGDAIVGRPPALLTVYGALIVDGAISGEICAASDRAVLDLSGAKSLSISSVEGNGDYEINWGGLLGALGGDYSKAINGVVTVIYTESSSAKGTVSGVANESFENKVYVGAATSATSYGWTVSGTYALSYENIGADGYTVTLPSTNPTTYQPSGDPIKLSAPTANGLKFAGWFTDSACSPESQITVLDGVTLFAENGGEATIYAKWVTETYTINFNTTTNTGNISSTPSYDSIPVASGSNFNPYTNTELADFTALLIETYNSDRTINRYFDGWYTSSSFSEATRIDENDGITVSANITIYAKWSEKHSLSFNMPSGKGLYSLNSLWLAPGESINLTTYDTQRASKDADVTFAYYFVGWFEDAAYEAPIGNVFVMGNSDVTCYARWDNKVTIKLTSDTFTYSYKLIWNTTRSADIVSNITVNGTKISVGGNFYLIPNSTCSIQVNTNTYTTSLTSSTYYVNVTGVTIGGTAISGLSTPAKTVTFSYTAPYSGNLTMHVSGAKE
ncbi:MAG: InlB B-repeat-containing protein [Clostridia bacterium]|nr:InlB B-repeat-containing protein [Clostridia bacterium]